MKKLLLVISMLIFIMSTFAVTDAYSMGKRPKPDPKPDPPVYVPIQPPPAPTPPPTPTPTPVPPPTNAVTEKCEMLVYAAETNCHFNKPIKDYGTFDFFVAGKKYVVKDYLKIDGFELRNSGSRGKMVAIFIPPKNVAVSVTYPSGGTPAPTPTPPPDSGIIESKDFSHINHKSWEGQGTTITFCPGDNMSSVTFHGVSFHLHGIDRGREMWTNHKWQGVSENGTAGEFVWVDKSTGKKYKHYSDGRGDGLSGYLNHKGDCFGVYR